MEVSGAPADVLLQRPWLPVSISGSQLLAKTWFGDSSYHILLTDMICVWEEWMDSAAIQRRSQELNKRLRAPVKAFFSHLCEVVQPCLSGSGTGGGGERAGDDEAQIALMRREGGDMVMRLKSELAGLPFYWEFHCTPAPATLACVQLVRPLLTMSRLLQRQVEQLGRLLTRKDAEIQDYRENGAALTRVRLQTDVFEEQTHREDFMAKTLPVLLSDQNAALGFDVDLQSLYAAVVAHGTANALKRKLSEEEERRVDDGGGDGGAAAEEPDLTPSLGVGSVSGETVESEPERNHNGQEAEEEEAGAKMAERATVKQSRPARTVPAERPPSKPKKKKVGLFR